MDKIKERTVLNLMKEAHHLEAAIRDLVYDFEKRTGFVPKVDVIVKSERTSSFSVERVVQVGVKVSVDLTTGY